MLRTNTCGELRIEDCGKEVVLCGWLHKSRDLGSMTFIDLRDRYGITQIVCNVDKDKAIYEQAKTLSREYVLQVKGIVRQRSNKNKNIPTGDIEIEAKEINVLNTSKIPPFTIEDNTDGGDELRMTYRYLDLRRNCVKKNLELRHRLAQLVRNYLSNENFMEIETPFLIRSTPEGARDFVVPSRMNPNQFYALPQSPQQYKQLLMVAGFDRYFQIVKCFRDEDLRADRQPEFTQIDCEMSFVEQEDVLNMFEGLIHHLFEKEKGLTIGKFQRMTWADAMKYYGSDKPDLRFGMKFVELNDVAKNKGFKVFDDNELVVGICAEGCAGYTRKQLDELTQYVQRPQVGAKGLVYIKYNEDGTFKSSIDKFFSAEDLKLFADKFSAKQGDLMLILSGPTMQVRTQLCALRLLMGTKLNLRDPFNYAVLWVTDFPLLEWNEQDKRFYAMHHPFTAPNKEDYPELLHTNPGQVRADAYDLVINGTEVGGGSVRIHDRKMQLDMFEALGFSEQKASQQFGFLMRAFEYGAPPHAGIAFGFDRLCSIFAGADSIRDFIAFPKNNSGRDLMSDSPNTISQEQLDELCLELIKKK